MTENSLTSYITPFLIANGMSNYVLHKQKEKKIIADFNKTTITKKREIPDENIIPNSLKRLVYQLEKNIDKENLNNLYRNLNDVTINKRFLMILGGIAGKYNSEKNTIDYSIKSALAHEFIHMASSYYDKDNNIKQSGFIDYSNNLAYGKALNEGYTDLLTRRIFNPTTKFYNEEVRVVRFVELLFDKKSLEKYYFTNDFIQVVKNLNKFMSTEEAIKLITTFDLGFDLKRQGNPAYKIIYTNLELKISDIFEKNNKSLLKQVDYLKLLSESPITSTIQKIKK